MVFIYFSYDPTSSQLFPKCPFFLLTGYKCPGCGSQRAIHSLLHLDIPTAFSHNALLVLLIPFLLVLVYAEIMYTKKPNLYRRVNSQGVILTIFILILLWWILRNLFHL